MSVAGLLVRKKGGERFYRKQDIFIANSNSSSTLAIVRKENDMAT